MIFWGMAFVFAGVVVALSGTRDKAIENRALFATGVTLVVIGVVLFWIDVIEDISK